MAKSLALPPPLAGARPADRASSQSNPAAVGSPPRMRTQYELNRVLGTGTFGVVHLAYRVPDRTPVVIKSAKKGGDTQAELERRILMGLLHPNIVRLLDSFPDERQGTHNLVLEYCDGGDLDQAIKQKIEFGESFPESQIRQWFAEMVSALYYCHLQHILHRDLKTANVFLHNGRVKIGDFGLARVLTTTSDFARTKLGTPAYLSPEVICSSPYNSRTDIWALGIILYELLSLEKPFFATTVHEIFEAITKDPVPSLDRLQGVYSSDLLDLVLKLLHKNPTCRPSAADLLQLPWVQKELEGMDLDLEGRIQRSREDRAWRKVRVRATCMVSTMLEMCRHDLTVNLRRGPSTRSDRLGTISRGDIVEEIGRLRDEDRTLWIQLIHGWCIAKAPETGVNLFREVADWRVIRPNARASPEPEYHAPEDEEILPGALSKPSADDMQQVYDLLAHTSTISNPSQTDLAPLRAFLATRLSAQLIDQLLDDFAASATPLDDMSWTIHAADTLRPLKHIPCILILRFLSLHGAVKIVDQPTQPVGQG